MTQEIKWNFMSEHQPMHNRYIIFIGKGGKTGYGLTCRYNSDYAEVRVGFGGYKNPMYKEIYAWAYYDIPPEVYSEIKESKSFKNSTLGLYLTRELDD